MASPIAPPEVCPEHDLRIDQYGCWACGHGGPLTDEAWPSYVRWSLDFTGPWRDRDLLPSRTRA